MRRSGAKVRCRFSHQVRSCDELSGIGRLCGSCAHARCRRGASRRRPEAPIAIDPVGRRHAQAWNHDASHRCCVPDQHITAESAARRALWALRTGCGSPGRGLDRRANPVASRKPGRIPSGLQAGRVGQQPERGERVSHGAELGLEKRHAGGGAQIGIYPVVAGELGAPGVAGDRGCERALPEGDLRRRQAARPDHAAPGADHAIDAELAPGRDLRERARHARGRADRDGGEHAGIELRHRAGGGDDGEIGLALDHMGDRIARRIEHLGAQGADVAAGLPGDLGERHVIHVADRGRERDADAARIVAQLGRAAAWAVAIAAFGRTTKTRYSV